MNHHQLTGRLVFNQNVDKFVKDGGGVENATNTAARRLRNENYAYYQPLDPDIKEIRLLSVMPSQHDDEPLSCFLTNETILEMPYVALSYCWGDMEKQEGITVSHASRNSRTILFEPFHALRVTEDLFNALKNIRRTLRLRAENNFSVKFWIDALCINQGDNVERSQQVGLMDQIYANADQVWVWFGDNEEIRSSLRWLQRLGRRGYEEFGSYLYYLNLDRRDSFTVLSKFQSEIDKAELGNLPDITGAFWPTMRQPWFERIWVLQEVFCARSRVVAYAGLNSLVDFDTVMLGNHYFNLSYSMSEKLRETEFGHILRAWKDLFRNSRQNYIGGSAGGGMMNLIELFRYTCHVFKATDPRDKLFALLGLARETYQIASSSYLNVQKPPTVDYTKTISEVFCDFTLWCIEKYRNLDVLSVVGETNCHFLPSYRIMSSEQEYDQDLPSWALWHSGKSFELRGNITIASQPFEISGKRGVDIAALRRYDSLTLTLKGVRLGIVKSVGFGVLRTREAGDDWKPESKGFHIFDYRTHGYRWLPLCSLWYIITSRTAKMEGRPAYRWLGHDESAYNGDEEAMFRDFLETIMLRAPEPGSRNIWEAEEIAHKLALDWKQHDPELQHLPPSVRDFMKPLVTKKATWHPTDGFLSLVPIPGKVLFISDEWRLGLCPAETEAGDVIVVLFGGKVPFILRPKQSAPLPGQTDGQEWEFIGECFVHGRMHSGMVDEKLRQNVPIENFHLV